MRAVDRILEVARGHRPLGFADRESYQGELLAALALAGHDVRGDCRSLGGRVDLLVDGSVAVEVDPSGPSIDLIRRLCRLANGGDLDAIVVLTDDPAYERIELFSYAVPVTLAPLRLTGAESRQEAEAA